MYAVNCLQVALCACNPGDNANRDGLVQGHGLPSNNMAPANTLLRNHHPLVGAFVYLSLSPYGPHETNAPQCRTSVDVLKTCEEFAGVDLNPHKQNDAKKEAPKVIDRLSRSELSLVSCLCS